MRKDSVIFEVTDGEIRVFWFPEPPFGKKVHSTSTIRFDRIPISSGLIEQGNVRNEKALINTLLTYASQQPSKSLKAYLAIPLQQGFIQAYTLPWIPKRDRKSAIALLVDEEISMRSDLLYDYLIISEEKPKNLQILLGTTRRSILEQYVYIFNEAGFKITGVDFAFSVLGQALGFEHKEDVLYLQGESDCIQMALFRGRVPENLRTLLPFQRLHSLPLSVESEGREKDQTEEWEKEIRRFLLYFRTQQTDLNLKRLVWSGDPITHQLAQSLLASNHVSSVEQATIRNVPDSWREVLAENTGRVEVVAGYALRVSAQHPYLNLWRQSNLTKMVQRRCWGMAILSVALFLIGTIVLFSLYQRVLPLQKEVEELALQGTRIEAQAKDQDALEIAWNRARIHSESIGDDLNQVQSLMSAELNIEQVTYKQGSMSLRGSAHNARSVQTLIRSMQTMGWELPALSSYKLTSLNHVEFSLSAKHR